MMTRRGRMGWTLLGLGALAGCGGETASPNPPPPPPPSSAVASVLVAPGNITPFPGDTVRLTATPKTASGADVSGKTVTWSSSVASVVSVSQSGLVTAATPGTATVTATVDGKSGTAQVTVLSRVALDVGRLVSKPVGPSGDSLSTTASNGIKYTLVVPEGALRTGVTITLTPLVSLAGLPFSGGLLAGVELKPSGTDFDRPLTLRIASAGSVPVGKTLIGFTAPDSGGAVTLLPAARKDGIISIVVPHFSIVGAAPALPSELAAIAPPVDVQSRFNDLADVARIIAGGSDLTSTLNQLEVVFSRWYARILPLLNSGLSGDPELLGALQEYRFWLDMMAYAGNQLGTSASLVELPSLASLNSRGQAILYFDLVAAIARANQACLPPHRDLNKAELALFWQAAGDSLGLATKFTVSTGIAELSRAVVLANLCVRVFVSDSTFPATPAPNQSSDLKLRFGLQFGSDPNLRNATFLVRLTFSGTPADGPADFTTDASGTLAVSVVPTGQRALRITAGVCLVQAVAGEGRICLVTPFTIDRVFGTTVTGDVTVLTPQGLASLSHVSKIIGNLTITGPMTNLEDLASLQEVTGRVTLNALPELTSLTGLRNLRTLTHLTLTDLARLPTVDGLDNLRAVPGTLALGSLPLVRNLQGLAQLLQVGSLQISNLPQLQSLTGLQAGMIGAKGSLALETLPLLDDIGDLSGITQISGTLSLRRLPRLASLRGLRNAQLTSDATVFLTDLPLLTSLSDLKPFPATFFAGLFLELPLLRDLAPMRTVTIVTNLVWVRGTGLADLSDLAALTTVGSLQLGGSGLSLAGLGALRQATVGIGLEIKGLSGAISFPALTDAGAISILDGNVSACQGTLAVSFPVLTTTAGVILGQAECSYTFRAPALTQAFQVQFSGAGLRQLTIGGASLQAASIQLSQLANLTSVTISGSLRITLPEGPPIPTLARLFIGDSPALTQISLGGPVDIALDFILNANASLSSVTALTGVIRRSLDVRDNPNLSTQAVQAWPVTVGGAKTIVGNKVP